MAIKLTDLIDRIPPDVEAKVRRVRDQVRRVVVEALRSECRLVFRTQEESGAELLGRPGSGSRWHLVIRWYSRISYFLTTSSASCCSDAIAHC